MFVVAKELVGLPGMPVTTKGIRQALDRAAGDSETLRRRRKGTNAFEYHIDLLPEAVRTQIREKHFLSVIEKSDLPANTSPTLTAAAKTCNTLDIVRQCPALLDAKLSEINDKQRAIADARMIIVNHVLQLETQMSRAKAIEFIVQHAKAGTLPDTMMAAVMAANSRKSAGRTISYRVVYSWLLNYIKAQTPAERLALLAPGYKKKVKPEYIDWLPQFLVHYRKPSGPTMTEAYQDFCAEWRMIHIDEPAMLKAMPSYDAILRAMRKLPPSVKNHGRVTGSALRATQIYVKRDWSQLRVNDVWIGDGHSMKLKVAHPIHGSPFTPELTMNLDGASRYANGWALSLAENTLAVADSIRTGIKNCGRPLMYYSDNGAGETGKMLDAPLTGILTRAGIHHETGIPGNPQGRGIIERLNKVIPAKVAKKFATYYGADADRETTRKTLVGLNSASNALSKGKALNARQQADIKKLPSWGQLLDAIQEVVDWYNNHHEHSELPKKPNGRHYTPAEYRQFLIERDNVQLDYLSEIELRDMFQPQETRTVERGWIRLFNNDYSAFELADFDKKEVIVGYDMHDAQRITVRRMDGTFICYAILNGNKRDAFPKAQIERLRERRVKGMKKRAEDKIALAEAELRPVLEHKPKSPLIINEPLAPEPENKVYLYEWQRDEAMKKQHRA